MKTHIKILVVILAALFFQDVVYAQKKNKFTISGQLKDATTGEDVPFANVAVTNLPGVGVTSNVYGFYSITLEEGEYTLAYQFVGYQTVERTISLHANTKLNVEMETNTEVLEAVEITGEKENENISRNEGSVELIDMQEVKAITSFGGEPDVIKIIQMKPGIKQAGEGNTGFYVRGGGLDQNLILLDEAPVYNPAHILGIFSVFNGDALKGASLYKGGMNAEYGGRTSSVMDIRMKDGNRKKLGVSGGIGLLSTRLTVEAPIVKDKGSFILSGRRTYADLIAKAAGVEDFENSSLFFHDFNAKANYRINDKNRVYLSGYFGRDKLGFQDQFGITWGNATGTFRLNHLFSDKLFSNTSLIYSDYQFEFSFASDENRVALESVVKDINVKQDFTYYLNDNNTLKFGVNGIQHNLEPGNLTAGSNSGFTAQDAESKQGLEGAIYIQNKQNVTGNFNLNYGLRYSFFNQTGAGNAYTFDDDGELIGTEAYDKGESIQYYGGFEPRLSANYQVNEFNSVKLGYNRNYQYIHLLTNATSSSPTDVWVLSSNNIKPQIADQVSLGYFRNFKDNMFETSAEVYYKDLQNVIDYRNGANVFLNNELEGELLSGDGEAYGLELLAKKNRGKLTGWVSYTLSRTFRQIDGLNNGKKFSARQDRIHDISIVALYELSKKVTLSGNLLFSTGDAVTYPSGKYIANDIAVPLYTERNGGRAPNFHRMDLGLTWQRKKTEKFESSWNFSLYNAYGQENAFAINFQAKEDNPNETEVVQLSLFKWIPSATYNFKF